jgi:hypothetical protein
MVKVSQGHIRSWITTVPPLPEQHRIVASLDTATARTNRVVVSVKDAIEGLREYRSALITAAVTGKIDVREEVPAC